MINISSFLSNKYLKFKNKDRNISLMIKICFLGITIGTCALMFTLIITNGFEKAIHEKMQGINSQVIISCPGNKLDYSSIKKFLETKFSNNIAGISASSIRQLLIDQNNSPSILFVKGIDPEQEVNVTNLAEKITLPCPTSKNGQKELLKELLTENKIIIGYKTAQNYNLKLGQKVNLLIPEPASKKKIYLVKKEAIIAGFFKIGLEEYDNNFAFINLDFLHKIFNEKSQAVDLVSLKLKEETYPNFFEELKNKLINLFKFQDQENLKIKILQQNLPHLNVQSWKELYPALVSSLKLEKYVMFIIIALITLVACLTMVSLLFMYIQQKRRDIAIFKSMGLSDKKIRSIFLRIGLRITFWATLIGLGLSGAAGYWLEHYPFIELPDVYYISYLPARVEPELFIVVFVVTMLLGFLATWIPAQRTKKINISQVLRQE